MAECKHMPMTANDDGYFMRGVEMDAKSFAEAAEVHARKCQVCGAPHLSLNLICELPAEHAEHWWDHHQATHQNGRVYLWHDPPSCDREHMTEAAERVVSEVRMLLEHHDGKNPHCMRGEKAHLREIRHELEQLDDE